MPRMYNFGAGPATMPEPVLKEVQEVIGLAGPWSVSHGNKSQKS